MAVCVAECSKRGLAIVPQGGGTEIRFGNKPARYDTKLSLAGMSRATARNPEDLTVTVDAGIPLSHLNRLLAGDGQRVALDADSAHRSTLGGLAAVDHRGRLAFRYGSPRDQILGMTVIDGRGRELRIGGKVVKNVAGYDLTRLFVGSYGTLGIITEITIRTYPLAPATADAVFEFDDARSADMARGRIFASRLPLAGFDAEADVTSGSGNWRLRCLLEGSAEEVEHQVERIEQLTGTPARMRIEIQDTSSFSRTRGHAFAAHRRRKYSRPRRSESGGRCSIDRTRAHCVGRESSTTSASTESWAPACFVCPRPPAVLPTHWPSFERSKNFANRTLALESSPRLPQRSSNRRSMFGAASFPVFI